MKKIICIVLTVLLLTSILNITVQANENSGIKNLDNSNNNLSEQKVVCTADINDDFSPNFIIVELDNKSSTKLKEYTAEDFAEVSAVSVRNLSSYTTEKLR